MSLSFEQLRNSFAKKPESSESGGFWSKFYPFYKMNPNEFALVRFIKDKDESNSLGFLMENKYHELIVNGDRKKVACLKMYGEYCPCCELSAKLYKEGDEVTGKKYYRRIDHLAQVLIISSPFDYEIKPEDNPVKLISIGPQVFKKIEGAFRSGDLDRDPTDLKTGYNFRIAKTKVGDNNNYTDSNFVRSSTEIPEDLIAKVDAYDLKTFRFPKIDKEAMELMIQADLTGGSVSIPDNNQATSSVQDNQSVTTVDLSQATQQPASTAPKMTAAEILAKYKAKASQ